MGELAFLTASELAPLIKSKQLSPVELTKQILTRIDTFDSTLHTYITPLHDVALQQAREVEHDILQGNYKGPLKSDCFRLGMCGNLPIHFNLN